MNKKIMMAMLLIGASTSFVAIKAMNMKVQPYLSREMSIPLVWTIEKNLLVLTEAEKAEWLKPGFTLSGQDITFNLDSLQQQFAIAANAYIANTNPATEKELATDLLRYFKIAYKVAINDKNKPEVRQQATAAANPNFSYNGVSLLEKAKANKNSILVQVLTELGAK